MSARLQFLGFPCLYRFPKLVHLFERLVPEFFTATLQQLFHASESIFEFFIGHSEGQVGIRVKTSGQIRDDEKQIAELLPDLSGITGLYCFLQFENLFLELIENGCYRWPVKSDLCRPP